jgi:hypothetical protein
LLVGGSVEIDRAAFDVVIAIDGAAVLHAADADHTFMQVSIAVEERPFGSRVTALFSSVPDAIVNTSVLIELSDMTLGI